MKTLKRLTIVLLPVLLAACVTTPSRVPSPVEPPAESPAPAPLPPPSSRPPTPAELAAVPDAVPRVEPRSRKGNPAFYDVRGRRYFVQPKSEGFVERGVASWYGPTFHEKSTSNGESYDMYAMTAAHKTLPLPSYARVTNLSNGRSVIVRINDRGPFVGNRIVDLSYTAAWKLDMQRAGTAFVELQVLTPGSLGDAAGGLQAQNAAATDTVTAKPVLYIQAGAFGVEENASRLANRLRAAGIEGATVRGPTAGAPLYRVRVGPIDSVPSYDKLLARLTALGVEGRLSTE